MHARTKTPILTPEKAIALAVSIGEKDGLIYGRPVPNRPLFAKGMLAAVIADEIMSLPENKRKSAAPAGKLADKAFSQLESGGLDAVLDPATKEFWGVIHKSSVKIIEGYLQYHPKDSIYVAAPPVEWSLGLPHIKTTDTLNILEAVALDRNLKGQQNKFVVRGIVECAVAGCLNSILAVKLNSLFRKIDEAVRANPERFSKMAPVLKKAALKTDAGSVRAWAEKNSPRSTSIKSASQEAAECLKILRSADAQKTSMFKSTKYVMMISDAVVPALQAEFGRISQELAGNLEGVIRAFVPKQRI